MTRQLESSENLLIDNILQANLGTWRIDFSFIFLEILIEPIPTMDEKLLSAILAFYYQDKGNKIETIERY